MHGQIPGLQSATALALPFKGETLDMVLLLPNPESDLGAMEDLMKGIDWPKTLSNLVRKTPTHTSISLPKFRIESSLSLVKLLEKMGVRDLFNVFNADLSGISCQEDLFVSLVILQACIEVDEGSPGPMLSKNTDCSEQPCLEFNRPFFYMVRERLSGLVVCMGRVNNPSLI